MKKSILLITDIFPPDIGGPASFIPDLALELAAMGYPVSVFCRSDTLFHPEDAKLPYRVYRTLRGSGYTMALQTLGHLILQVARHQIIFTNGLEAHTQRACRLLRRSYTLKVVGDLAWELARNYGDTDLSIDEFQHAALSGRAARAARQRAIFAQQARLIITPSDYLRRMVIGWGCQPDRVMTIFNGVRLNEFSGLSARKRNARSLHLIFVGRLVNWKGISHLLEALVNLSEVHLTVVGDGPEGHTLQRDAQRYGLQVDFAGKLSRQKTLEDIARADVLVLPSNYEGLSHTLLEACASGVPCIASDRGGNPEIIQDSVNGLLVPYGDVTALRAAIIRLRDDEAERLKLAQAAQQTSCRFDFQTTLQSTIQVLTS